MMLNIKLLQPTQDGASSFASGFTSFGPAWLSFFALGDVKVMPVKVGLFGGIFMLAMGGLFGFFGVWMFRDSYKKITKWLVAYGTVIGFEEETTNGKTHYRRKAEFQCPSGNKIVFTASTSSGMKPSIGRKVKVLYSPDDPTKADISSFLNLWLGPVVFLFFGAVFLVMSVLFFCAPFAGKK